MKVCVCLVLDFRGNYLSSPLLGLALSSTAFILMYSFHTQFLEGFFFYYEGMLNLFNYLFLVFETRSYFVAQSVLEVTAIPLQEQHSECWDYGCEETY